MVSSKCSLIFLLLFLIMIPFNYVSKFKSVLWDSRLQLNTVRVRRFKSYLIKHYGHRLNRYVIQKRICLQLSLSIHF